MLMLKDIRLKKSMSMKEVATQACISEGMYCLIEHQKRRPSVETAKRIANVLGIDWTIFFNTDSEERKAV